MLARRPGSAAVTRRDLLAAGKAPDHIADEVPLDEFQCLLVRRTRAAGSDDEAARQNASRPAGGVVEALPPLDDIAVHVDDEHCRPRQRRQHGEPVPGAIRVVDGRAGGINRLGPTERNRTRQDNGSRCVSPSRPAHHPSPGALAGARRGQHIRGMAAWYCALGNGRTNWPTLVTSTWWATGAGGPTHARTL